MPHPLPSSYNWRTPVAVATIGLILCVGLLARGRVAGWISVVVVLVLAWAALIAVAWLRTRAYLMVDGPILTTRRYRAMHRIDGRRLTSVRERTTGSGPSYRVRVDGAEDGDEDAEYYVPTALVSRGHSTFFEWVLRYAPGATLDKRSQRTIDRLRTRGLIP